MTIHLPALGPDLPVHPYTGLRALGLRRNGAPIWPVKGGSVDDGDDDGGQDDDNGSGDGDQGGKDDGGDGKEDLGDAGKQALDRMKGERNAARRDLRAWKALARELGVNTIDEVKALLGKAKSGSDGGKDDAPDAEQIRKQARDEARQEVLRDRVLDKIEAKARGFADPADAAALLLREGDLDDFLDGNKIDTDAITDALDELLKKKPYLAAAGAGDGTTGDGRRKPKPDPSQGARGGTRPNAEERAKARLARMGYAPKN